MIYHRLGNFDRAIELYQQATRQLDQCYSFNKTDDVLLEIARATNELGSVRASLRHYRHANSDHNAALAKLRTISANSSKVSAKVLRFEHARLLYLLNRTDRDFTGAFTDESDTEAFGHRPISPERKTNLAEAIKILEDLADRDTGNVRYQLLLTRCFREIASPNLDSIGRSSSRVAQAMQELEGLIQWDSEHPVYRHELCITLAWIRLSEEMSTMALEVALDRHQRAIKIAEGLVRDRSKEWLYALTHIEMMFRTVRNLQLLDRADEAAKMMKSVLDRVSKVRYSLSGCGDLSVFSWDRRVALWKRCLWFG